MLASGVVKRACAGSGNIKVNPCRAGGECCASKRGQRIRPTADGAPGDGGNRTEQLPPGFGAASTVPSPTSRWFFSTAFKPHVSHAYSLYRECHPLVRQHALIPEAPKVLDDYGDVGCSRRSEC